MPRSTRNSVQDMDDHTKSISDWKKLSSEALKLKCNELQLVTVGSKTQLAERLVEYFQHVNEHVQQQQQQQQDAIPQHVSGQTNDLDIRFTREVITDSNKENIENNVNITNNELLAELRSISSKFQILEERQQQQEVHLDRYAGSNGKR